MLNSFQLSRTAKLRLAHRMALSYAKLPTSRPVNEILRVFSLQLLIINDAKFEFLCPLGLAQ